MNREQAIDIDLLKLFRMLWDNLKYIVLVVVVFAGIGFAYASFAVTPIYEASAKMIVNTRGDKNQSVTNDQLNSAKSLTDTYAIIIRGRDVLNRVIEELELKESYGQLASKVSVHAVNETQVIQINVQHENKDVAYAVAAKILEITPNIIVETVEAGSVKPVEQAYVGSSPVSPNPMKNAVLLGMFGFVLACIVSVLVFFADNTYKNDEDIENELELPVLGVIPTIESCNNSAEYGYGQKKGM